GRPTAATEHDEERPRTSRRRAGAFAGQASPPAGGTRLRLLVGHPVDAERDQQGDGDRDALAAVERAVVGRGLDGRQHRRQRRDHRLPVGGDLHGPSSGARRAPSADTTCSAISAGIAAAIRSGVSCARTAWATATASTSTGAPTRSATLLSSVSTWPLVSAAMRE